MSFTSYDNLDDMLADMREKEDEANASVLDCQRAVTWGSHYVRLWTDVSPPLVIFGYIHTEKELDAKEKELGAGAEERMSTMRRMRDSHERGYRFGRHYSVVEPDGELGSVHIANVLGAITAEQFERAELFGWQLDHIAREPWFRSVLADFMREVMEKNQSD